MKRWRCPSCARTYAVVSGSIKTCRLDGAVLVEVGNEVVYEANEQPKANALTHAATAWLFERSRA